MLKNYDLYVVEQRMLGWRATELEILEEEKELIQRIEVENIPFYGSHPINAEYVAGMLPNDKEEMVKIIEDSIKAADEEFLNSSAIRSSL